MMPSRFLCSFFPLALISLVLAVCGCHTTRETAPGTIASVVLHGNTPGQIGDAVIAVFNQNGYITMQAGLNDLVFEKKGSKMNNLAYGSWMGEEPVWVRVRLTIIPVGEAVCRLECRAFLVKDRGTAAEETFKVNRLHSSRYEQLLDEVASRLNGAWPAYHSSGLSHPAALFYACPHSCPEHNLQSAT